jgi:hypothetical protein
MSSTATKATVGGGIAALIMGVIWIVIFPMLQVINVGVSIMYDASVLARALAGDPAAIKQVGEAIWNIIKRDPVEGYACAVQLSPNAPGNALEGDTWQQAVTGDAGSDNRLAMTLFVGGYAASGGNAKFAEAGHYGIYGILDPGSGENYQIKMEEALNPALATNFMVSRYKNALQTIDPNLWKTKPEEAAGAVAFAANEPNQKYSAAAIHTAYQKALADMRKQKLSVDFSIAPDTSDSPSVPLAGLNGKNVPEPMRSWIVKAATKYNVPPAAVAGLYLTEQNGFSLYYKYVDSNHDVSVVTGLTPTSPEWHLDKYGANGVWPDDTKTSANPRTFRGPFQFGPVWESTYAEDGDKDLQPDVDTFADAVFGAAHYLADLGATMDKGIAGVSKAAESYNGQISWDIGGGIRNPDPSRFTYVKQLYAAQVVLLTQALSGGSPMVLDPMCASIQNTDPTQFFPPGSAPYMSLSEKAAREKLLAFAQTQKGVPYSWGGGHSAYGPTYGICTSGAASNDCNVLGMDCSGFTRYVFHQIGIDIGDTAASQWQKTRIRTVPQNQAQPGDLVFFTGADGTRDSPGHVGIYIGGGKMINAPQSGDVIKISDIMTPYRQNQLVGFTNPYVN